MTTITAPKTTATAHSQDGALTGTWQLVRFMLRRDRIRIPAWTLGLAIATAATAASLADLYVTEAERQSIAETLESPASIAMQGVNHGLADYHYGAMMAHQMLWFTAIMAGLMSVLLLVRHTRLEEATGRAELVRAGVVGRHATTAAALMVVTAANVLLAVLLAVSLGATGLEGITWGGSWLYGAAHAGVGIVFMGLAAVTVQVTEHSRGAAGMAIGGLGLAYALRASGDAGDGTLSWLSPIGWAQATQVYVNNRWWPLLVAVAAAGILVALGMALSTRRDVGAGLRPPRSGSPTASEALSRPLGFALRLHRASLIGWTAALFLLGTMYGSILGDAEQMLTDIEALEDFLLQLEGISVTDSFASMVTTVLVIIASIYAVLAALRMRSEETSGRAEPVLATALSQPRWIGSHVAVAMAGATVVAVAGGLGIGLAGAAATGDASMLPRLVGASLAYAPALWVVVAVVVALFGWLPRGVMLAWVVVVYSFVVLYLGNLLQFPDWMDKLSPFGHVPQQPAESFRLTPLIVLTVVAAMLAAAGTAGFRRRDLATTA